VLTAVTAMHYYSWHQRARDCWQRRIVVIVSLAAYLITAVGVPVPASVHKSSDVPFPCQHHACGCASAQQCWKHCCCYTPAQKLAWAYEHHVDPPADLVAEVAAGPHFAEQETATKPASGCCAHKQQSSAHAAEHCHDRQHGVCDDHEESSHVTLIIGAMARKCRGLTDLWCAFGAVLPPTVLNWHFEWNVVEWIAAAERPLPTIDQSPPNPPPRV
jgi:hypothetical protein